MKYQKLDIMLVQIPAYLMENNSEFASSLPYLRLGLLPSRMETRYEPTECPKICCPVK
jgi:hypothetical protein